MLFTLFKDKLDRLSLTDKYSVDYYLQLRLEPSHVLHLGCKLIDLPQLLDETVISFQVQTLQLIAQKYTKLEIKIYKIKTKFIVLSSRYLVIFNLKSSMGVRKEIV